jgi:hypothetical protein
MPAPWVYEASDGVLVVYNRVTRATRIAKVAPGATIRVEVVGKLRRAYAGEPKIGGFGVARFAGGDAWGGAVRRSRETRATDPSRKAAALH